MKREKLDKSTSSYLSSRNDGSFDWLEHQLVVDEFSLEEALTAQPDLFYRVSRELALTISRRDAAKQLLGETEARVDMHVRRAAQEQDRKITEREVAGKVQMHSDVVKANRHYLELNQSVGEWQALKEAFSQRGYVLKELVSLYIHQYYGDTGTNVTVQQARTHSAQLAKEEMHRQRKRG